MWITMFRNPGTLSFAALAPMAVLPLVFSVPGATQAARPQPATAQAGERVSVSFSDPARPGLVKVSLITGSIVVKAHDGKEVTVEVRPRIDADDDEDDEDRNEPNERHGGLKRIPNRASGLTVEEENNEMRIGSSMPNREMDIIVTVPVRTSLKLSTINDGDISVEGVEGDIDVNNVNGGVTLTNVSGTVLAHALNEDVKVSLRQVAGKPMSFSSLNGDIDVTLPAETRANVRLETAQGDIYSDFDIEMQPSSPQQFVEDDRAKGGKYRVKLEKAMVGRINGGGPEIKFKNFNGDIHIRKAK